MSISSNPQLGWMLLLMGIVMAVLGVLVLIGPSIPWLGHLPGDIRIERENFRFYFPLTSSIVLSIVLSGILWLMRFLSR